MPVRTRLIIAMLWLISLVAVAAVARAQTAPVVPLDAKILSGSDIGFRVESMNGNTPVGTLVIRLKGQWVEPTIAKKIVAITR